MPLSRYSGTTVANNLYGPSAKPARRKYVLASTTSLSRFIGVMRKRRYALGSGPG